MIVGGALVDEVLFFAYLLCASFTSMHSDPNRLPVVERLNNGMPLIARDERHPWENKVTFNPAAILVDDHESLSSIIRNLPFDEPTKRGLSTFDALCFLLYRAQGRKTTAYDHTRSSLGLAILTPELKVLARHTKPVLLPDVEYDNLGVEDGRLTRIGDSFVLLYCGYSAGIPKNNIRIAMASTKDFVSWKKHGLLNGDFNRIDNKNAMLFPEPIDGKYILLHRPMEGPNAMAIHWAEAQDIFGEWKSRGMLMASITNPAFINTWVGGGAPPLKLPDGRFLLIYHIGNRESDKSREYDLGIAILDPTRPEPIVKREEPVMRPERPAETTGDADLGVNNVLFICAAHFYRDDLYFPYAGADSVVLGARITKAALERYLNS